MSPRFLAGVLVLAAVGCQDKKIVAPKAAGTGAQNEANARAPAADAAPPERKIIYTARVDLHVADLDEARGRLDALLVEVKGYVAKSDETGRAGGIRAGTWKVRVPVAKYEEFLSRVKTFGELVSQSSDAQDVTEEFVDTEARLKNLKAEETVLNKLLQEKAQSTADLLAFRQQISGVREQIERYQARLDNLSRLTALTTIDVAMREDRQFVPDSAPSFGTSAGRTFQNSVDSLLDLGKGLVLMVVALAPWSPLILVGVWLVRRPLRRAVGGMRSSRPSPSDPPRPRG